MVRKCFHSFIVTDLDTKMQNITSNLKKVMSTFKTNIQKILSNKTNNLNFEKIAESSDVLGTLLNDVVHQRNEEKMKRESVFIE